MSSLQKFKSFEEADNALLEESFRNNLNKERAERFFEEVAHVIKNPYQPGLYRFRSFREASNFDLSLYAQWAVKNRHSC